ncbi:hypothetical protein [Hymenobacter perfusus]|uniref:Uncharacterized protein n=1 Tax=Hymenobacter perfusus TaxID=1236770 RepID=A0A428KD32_9BACT|nr:hypothetical protein [Hymenobacter perfusus]RSK44324.1 hypothetical protein EI293_07240 [Hymenobacter perfusus]
MYSILLLSEDYFSGLIFLFEALVTAALYGLALFFLLYKRRTSKLKPIGVGLACVLAVIGLRAWPEPNLRGGYSTSEYVLVLFLCMPLMVSGIVYFSSRNLPNE